MRAEGFDPAAVVRVSETEAVAARHVGREVQVLHFGLRDGSWATQAVATAAGHAGGSASMVAFEAENASVTYLFGSAPASVSRVTTEPEGIGGQVVRGTWVVVLDSAPTPDVVTWTFVDALGAVVQSGTGLHP